MSKVIVDMGMSLDGFIAEPNASPRNPLGDGGHRIHRWMYDVESWRERQSLTGGQINQDDEVVKEIYARTGAYVMGRRMFDEGEVGWPDPPPFHAPVFVLTHRARAPWVRQGGTTFTFVTDGIESALEQEQPRAIKTSGSRAARTPSGSASNCSTNCRSTSPPYCSATGSDCSTTSTRSTSNWKRRGSSTPPRSHISDTAS